MDWIHLVQDKDHWCVVVNMVISFVFHKRWKIS